MTPMAAALADARSWLTEQFPTESASIDELFEGR